MHTRRLGRTQLQVSEIGLGGVRFASAGQAPNAIRVIHRAMELGVNLIDTAPGYGDSETIIGRALIDGKRKQVLLSSKYYPYKNDGTLNLSGEALARSVANSLRNLGTGYLDVLHLHWVQRAADVDAILNSDLGRTLQRLQSLGNIRHLAISEASELDGEHTLLRAALATNFFSVIMVTYNIFLQTAEKNVFPLSRQTDTGVLVMMPLNQPMGEQGLVNHALAKVTLDRMRKAGAIPDQPPYTGNRALDFLLAGTNRSLPQAAIRFILDHPDVSSVLTGTNAVAHLEENLCAATQPSLPPEVHAKAREMFGGVTQQIK